MNLADDVSIVRSEHGVTLLHERTGRYWQLNQTGALILDTLTNGGTVEDASNVVVSYYPVDAERATRDITALLESLRSAGLMKS